MHHGSDFLADHVADVSGCIAHTLPGMTISDMLTQYLGRSLHKMSCRNTSHITEWAGAAEMK